MLGTESTSYQEICIAAFREMYKSDILGVDCVISASKLSLVERAFPHLNPLYKVSNWEWVKIAMIEGRLISRIGEGYIKLWGVDNDCLSDFNLMLSLDIRFMDFRDMIDLVAAVRRFALAEAYNNSIGKGLSIDVAMKRAGYVAQFLFNEISRCTNLIYGVNLDLPMAYSFFTKACHLANFLTNIKLYKRYENRVKRHPARPLSRIRTDYSIVFDDYYQVLPYNLKEEVLRNLWLGFAVWEREFLNDGNQRGADLVIDYAYVADNNRTTLGAIIHILSLKLTYGCALGSKNLGESALHVAEGLFNYIADLSNFGILEVQRLKEIIEIQRRWLRAQRERLV